MKKASPAFSFLVLSFNDEMHLGRLFESIKLLGAATYVLDSGSTDKTLEICSKYAAEHRYRTFDNHPKQWHHALQVFNITTPWVIALDADQVVSPELFSLLQHFNDQASSHLDGIYFNRKNYHRGRWIRHGGYFPFYMLKMFRVNVGFSDLNENMDHRFIVPGRTCIWKRGFLIEENLKEHSIQFWIDKHGRYSDLLAQEEVERRKRLRAQVGRPAMFGSPNERKAYYKRLWWRLPRYIRPTLYFFYRMVIQRGFLDGRNGIIFHFLQGFWFRLIVDIKIDELLGSAESHAGQKKKGNKHVLFIINFVILFSTFYGFNILFIGITAEGGIYLSWVDKNLNYIQQWRTFNLASTASILNNIGYEVKTTSHTLSVAGHAGFKLVYSCLGFGIMSFYAAFVLAYPKPNQTKIITLIIGLLSIQLLNQCRFLWISIYWNPTFNSHLLDHHVAFNIFIYTIVFGIIVWSTRIKNKIVLTQPWNTQL